MRYIPVRFSEDCRVKFLAQDAERETNSVIEPMVSTYNTVRLRQLANEPTLPVKLLFSSLLQAILRNTTLDNHQHIICFWITHSDHIDMFRFLSSFYSFNRSH